MDEVARLACVSKQAIYRRWSSKSDLLIDAVNDIIAKGLHENALPADPIEALRELSWRWLHPDIKTLHGILSYLQLQALSDNHVRQEMIGWHDRVVSRNLLYLNLIETHRLRRPGHLIAQATMLVHFIMGLRLELVINEQFSEADIESLFNCRWKALAALMFIDDANDA
jgi:AcrR family transcriptional regulator